MMRAHWQPEGYTVPNATTYPFQWLWDSCFHSIIWAELGDTERALIELAHVFRMQDDDGFVPHVDYERDPGFLASFWGREGASTITQPPVHGHTISALRQRGVVVPGELVERSVAHLAWFLRERRHRSGLIAIRHPWETGCDDSARFDSWGAADRTTWFEVKGELLRRSPRSFDCAPVSLSAIVAWSCRQLAIDDEGLTDALARRWDGELRTWVDAGSGESTSGRTRTLEGLLPQLVDPRPEVVAELADPSAYCGAYGPRGAHPAEPSYAPDRYWRGPVWPQLAYLLWCASSLTAEPVLAGASASGLAELWNPETGAGRGAIPQSWAGLALLMADPA
ncbi:MAG: MGH1-like glycoside hydrolase domain-containing protein [Acidimicrobiales bacterium]